MFAKANAIKYAFYAPTVITNLCVNQMIGFVGTEKRKNSKEIKVASKRRGSIPQLARTNDNAYKLAFHDEHSVSATFNVSPFDVGVVDLRTNPLKRKGNMETYKRT